MSSHNKNILAARLRDPRESDLPDVGLVTFEDPETGEQLTVNTSSKRLRERFAQAAAAQAERIKTSLNECGVQCFGFGGQGRIDLPAILTGCRRLTQQVDGTYLVALIVATQRLVRRQGCLT